MMRRTLAWLSTGMLLVACGDDTTNPSPADGTTTSADSGTTTAPPPGTDSSGPAMTDSTGDSATTNVDSSTGPSESTGPIEGCGNNMIEDAEVCDGTDLAGEDCMSQGFDGGELACAPDCTGFNTGGCTSFGCGNGVAEVADKEVCDGDDTLGETCQTQGFDSGEIGCTTNCQALDVSGCGTCGNVVVDGDEVCDDIALFGQTCESQGFDSGQLGCNPDCLTYNETGCGTCGNKTIDGDEVCDGAMLNGETCIGQGFTSGSMGCAEDCLTFVTEGCGFCGNEVIDGDEICDGSETGASSCDTEGFDNGTLGCMPGCMAFDTSTCGICGNGIVDGSEVCDTDNLNGNTCDSLGLGGGDLGCHPNCFYDFSGCDEDPGGIACDTAEPPNCFPAAFMAVGGGNFGSLWAIALDGSQTLEIGPILDPAGAGVSVTGLAFHPDGTLYAMRPQVGELGTINTITAEFTPIGPTMTAAGALHDNLPDMAFVGTQLFGWSEFGDDLVMIDTATAEITVISSPQGSAGTAFAYNSATDEMLLAPNGSGGTLYTIDDLGNVVAGPFLQGINGNVKGMSFLDGLLYGLDSSNGIGGAGDFVTYDPDTGVRTLLAPLPVGGMDSLAVYDQMNFVSPPLPE